MTALMNLGATLVAVFVFAIAAGVYPTWSWLELPLLIAVLAVAATGTGMLLAVLFVRYRDVQPIWDVATQILFYASPILYVATMVPEDYRQAYLFNPLAAILTQVRHAVVDPAAPTACGGDRRRRLAARPARRDRAGVRARRLGVPARGAADRREPLARSRGTPGAWRGARRGRSPSPRRSRRRPLRGCARAAATRPTPARACASSSARWARACAATSSSRFAQLARRSRTVASRSAITSSP